MKSPKTPKPPAPIAVTQASGSDVAQDAANARRRERNRFDFSRTILRPGSSSLPEGMKSTLG